MNGWAVSRAEIIRALIGAVADSGIELEDVQVCIRDRALGGNISTTSGRAAAKCECRTRQFGLITLNIQIV